MGAFRQPVGLGRVDRNRNKKFGLERTVMIEVTDLAKQMFDEFFKGREGTKSIRIFLNEGG